MKLTNIALSTLVLLGAVAVGGSYFTGQQAEEKYREFAMLGNQQLSKLSVYGIQAQIKNIEFERGFFSSKVSYTLEAANATGETLNFQAKDTLYHGPFPLNRLKQGNIMPVLASTENRLLPPERLKSAFNNDLMLTGQTNIDYSGGVQGELNLSPLNFENSIKTERAKIEYDVATSGKGELEVHIPQLSFIGETTLELTELKARSAFDEDNGYPFLALGTFEGSLAKLILRSQDTTANANKPEFVVQQLKLNGRNALKGNDALYAGESEMAMAFSVNTPKGSLDFGKLQWAMQLESDAKLTNDLLFYANAPEAIQTEQAVKIAQDLLMKGGKLHLSPVILENSEGKNTSELVLNLAPFDFTQINDLKKALGIFQQSKLSAKISLPYSEAILTKMAITDGADPTEAKRIAQEGIERITSEAQQSPFFALEKDNITLDLTLDQGKVTLKGRDVPESEVEGFLFVLMLMLGLKGN